MTAQVKDALTTKSDDFGTPCSVSSATLKEVIRRSGVVEAVVDASARADRLRLKRTNRAAVGNRKRDFINVPKLEDAVLAGTKQSNDCTLIITEGDSAKALAVAGFEVVGREKYVLLFYRVCPLVTRLSGEQIWRISHSWQASECARRFRTTADQERRS